MSTATPSSTVAFIFARGGSKGLPGKNIRPLAGEPLIAHAVKAALASQSIDRVMVSTDDPAIAEAARAAGAEVPFLRPAELASDTSPEWLSWRHAVDYLDAQGMLPERFVTVPATAPLRLPQDIDACVARFAQGDVDVAFTVCESAANPYFNLVTLDAQGHAHRMTLNGAIARRQDAPTFFEIIPACYVTTPAFIRQADGLFDGKVGVVEIPRQRAADIDDLCDFHIAEALWPHRQPVEEIDTQGFLPYGRQAIDEADIAAVGSVLRGGFLTGGPAVAAFEQALCDLTGAAYAAACSTGTAALHLAYAALGVGPGDCVIVPAVTFLATANAAHYVGAAVEFADVDAETGLMSVATAAEAIARAQAKGLTVRVLAPVYLNGQTGDPEGMAALAAQHNAAVVEDACHALGTTYRDSRGVEHTVGACAHAQICCFSFHPVKTIAMGEGGAVTTQNPALDHAMRLVRNHGMTRDAAAFVQPELALGPDGAVNPWYYEMQAAGNNYRASDIHCALGSSQLQKLPRFVAQRRALVRHYREQLGTLPHVTPLGRVEASDPAWHLCVALIDFTAVGQDRGTVMRALHGLGIGTQVHYMPVPWQPYWRPHAQDQGPWPGAEHYYARALSLPLFPAMDEHAVDRVIAALRTVLTGHNGGVL